MQGVMHMIMGHDHGHKVIELLVDAGLSEMRAFISVR